MKKLYDVCIIGGGASGCAAGIHCARNGLDVLILEKENRLAKKVLATGNGRCNLSNTCVTADYYNLPDVAEVINKFSTAEVLEFFCSLGVECYADDEGRIYPLSNSAADIALALTDALQNCDCVLNCVANEIRGAQGNFEIITNNGTFSAKNIICACGGNCGRLFTNFNYKTNVKKEILAALECDKSYNKALFGVRQNALVTCVNNNKVFCERGQVQFRKDGISGIVIFNLSAFIGINGGYPAEVSLDLMPKFSAEEIFNKLNFRKEKLNLTSANFLLSLLPNALAKEVMARCNLGRDFEVKKLTDNQLKIICDNIKNFKLTVVGTSGVGQVSSSGFDLTQFDSLESKLQKGVYACGESAGIYGYCGGYNLHFAWASGLFVAEKIIKKL